MSRPGRPRIGSVRPEGTRSQAGLWPPSSSRRPTARGSGWPVIKAGLVGSGSGPAFKPSPCVAGLEPRAPGLACPPCWCRPGRYQMKAATSTTATQATATASCRRHRQRGSRSLP